MESILPTGRGDSHLFPATISEPKNMVVEFTSFDVDCEVFAETEREGGLKIGHHYLVSEVHHYDDGGPSVCVLRFGLKTICLSMYQVHVIQVGVTEDAN